MFGFSTVKTSPLASGFLKNIHVSWSVVRSSRGTRPFLSSLAVFLLPFSFSRIWRQHWMVFGWGICMNTCWVSILRDICHLNIYQKWKKMALLHGKVLPTMQKRCQEPKAEISTDIDRNRSNFMKLRSWNYTFTFPETLLILDQLREKFYLASKRSLPDLKCHIFFVVFPSGFGEMAEI